MTAKVFVDSNILIYAHDVDERPKRDIAQDVLAELLSKKRGALSPQVRQEF